ncbi:MAG: hypothetical protein WA705_18110 [Candidatus Ozemobacteraceae bacterium]
MKTVGRVVVNYYRRGIALGVAMFILLTLFAAGMTISHLMRGLQKQVEYADSAVRAQYIGESGLNILLARLQSKPWEKRWFAPVPDSGTGIEYGGGSYEYFISDTANRPLHADIWVKSNYRNTKRFFFWRVKFQSSMLNGLAQGIPINSSEIDGSNFPVAATDLDALTAQIESQIDKRKDNRGNADTLISSIRTTNDIHQTMSNIGANPAGTLVGGPFSPSSAIPFPGQAPYPGWKAGPPPPPPAGNPNMGLVIPPPFDVPVSASEIEFKTAPALVIAAIDQGAKIKGKGHDIFNHKKNKGHIKIPIPSYNGGDNGGGDGGDDRWSSWWRDHGGDHGGDQGGDHGGDYGGKH